ncbi:molybdopterin converting factor subunit 1 [Methylibium sp.]|uniref:molybdopterin converting factor subunit 1 n=1 Tax=Methylibium sp. TaxID=2067992 RepID=UPI0017A5C6E5|nr:molybdopterin converting factor subunit 1 [Methylibium sp.]MBA3589617.1 molybdopterin converting factor subunit 1 [Methylibium sp.]
MRLQVRYFASIREALGPSETVEMPPGSTLGDLREQLISRGGSHSKVLSRGKALRTALDQVMAEETAPLNDGAEVAFFPPVTGG